jgi:hypothetical protein
MTRLKPGDWAVRLARAGNLVGAWLALKPFAGEDAGGPVL